MNFPMRKKKTIPFGWILLATGALIFGGYKIYQMKAAGNGADMMAMQAAPVDVLTLKPASVQTWQEFSGRTRAVDYAEIRPEVSGRITEIRFKDGDEVKKGDVLIVIDPRPFEAALAKAKAKLQSATTTAKLASTEATRAINMLKNSAITRSQHDQRINEQRVAHAGLEGAKADLEQASLDVEHAYVRAPFAGRVSRAEITVGNLVQAGGNAPLLTSVVSNKQIYADFELDEATYLAIASQSKTGDATGRPIELRLNHATDRAYKGQMATFDNHIDANSGTIRARATFNNDDGLLVPGMFVTVRLGATTIPDALLVPERAISTDQNKKYVYVIGEGNKATYREVTLGGTSNGNRIVTSGLKAGEKVIVDGIQHVRPDAVVAPTELGTKPATQPAAQPAAPKA
jgi:multidrug efflux system membrane fusion protein